MIGHICDYNKLVHFCQIDTTGKNPRSLHLSNFKVCYYSGMLYNSRYESAHITWVGGERWPSEGNTIEPGEKGGN
jgi:hypothetical protein